MTAAGGFPVVLDNLWLGREEGEAVAAALVPKLQKTKVAVEQLLFEVATLEVSGSENSWHCGRLQRYELCCAV
jgi:hypothetical protein